MALPLRADRRGRGGRGEARGTACAAATVVFDSVLWRRWLWPEGEVLYFNVALNKSHEWGASVSLTSFTFF